MAASIMRPPVAVQRVFAEGLDLFDQGLGGAGLRPETVAWARRLARGEAVTEQKARKMSAWFARHGASPREVAARHAQAEGLRSGTHRGRAPALVAWLLWGGDAGREWAERVVASEWERVLLPRRPRPRQNPPKLVRCVEHVMESTPRSLLSDRETKSRAYAICTATLQRSGYLVPGFRFDPHHRRGKRR